MEKRKGREEEEVVGFNHRLPPLHRFYSESGDFYSGSTPYKASPVLPMRAFPFTSPQWQELQRQALIYKHIMASVPVPPDLLLPISARAFPEPPPLLFQPTMVSGQNGFNLRFGSNSTDPEPARCRRTDGKKWRCSRDAEPDHKYCERHMNRGRPRSRKPVELKNNKNPSNSKPAVDADADVTTTGSVATKVEARYDLESLAPNRQWMQPHYEDLPNLNYTDLNLNFVDAWSTDADEAKLPSLSLSMSSNADVIDGEIQMGLGLAVKPMKWTGGPLAEALQSTTSNVMSLSPSGGSGKRDCVDLINLMCTKSCCGSQEVSPRDSSPSWVLHKPPVSVVSDSSSGSNNSSFQWMNCQPK